MSHYDQSSEPRVIDLENIFLWLEEKGTENFGKDFAIHAKDYKTIFKLIIYLYQDKHNAAKYNIDLRKGLLLSGPVGCGKTCLMTLIGQLDFPAFTWHLVSTREVCLQYMETGHGAIKYYSCVNSRNPQVFCFDDLGTEAAVKYYGNETNVMAEILLLRYDLFIQKRVPTHITTSLSASELEQRYGNRVRSRMREMFNLIAFSPDTTDKRT